MDNDEMLKNALANVRQRRAELQVDFDRVKADLAKLSMAERSLALIVEGPPPGISDDIDTSSFGTNSVLSKSLSGAKSQGNRLPRANSAKGRLKSLIANAGRQGLSFAEVGRALPDVAPGTLSAYLSAMVTSGEATRKGDFYSSNGALSSMKTLPSPDDRDKNI